MRTVALLSAVALLAATATAEAQTRRQRERAPAAPPGDKRDRLVVAPGSPFNNAPYWQALAQCGGVYFKLGILYNDTAIRARVTKPDKAVDAEFSKKADEASKTASAFFDAAERVLIADRSIERTEAIMTYDARASAEIDRIKTVDVALKAAQPCPALYQTCRQAQTRICTDAQVSEAR